MATEIVAQIDAAWSADKMENEGRATHRMIGPQPEEVDLHQCARDNRTERNGWLSGSSGCSRSRPCRRPEVDGGGADLLAQSSYSADRQLCLSQHLICHPVFLPSTLHPLVLARLCYSFRLSVDSSFVGAAAVAAAHRLNDPLLSGRENEGNRTSSSPIRSHPSTATQL
jgi:hypothetical protein